MTCNSDDSMLIACHEVESFRSGALSLDEWLRRHALQSHRSGGSRVFVTTEVLMLATRASMLGARSCSMR